MDLKIRTPSFQETFNVIRPPFSDKRLARRKAPRNIGGRKAGKFIPGRRAGQNILRSEADSVGK